MNRLSLPSVLLSAVALSLLAGPGLRPAGADVSFRGGSPTQRAALQRVYDNQIPAAFRHADEVVPVQLLTDREMDAAVREDADGDDVDPRDVDGLYSDETGRIQIRASQSPTDLAQTFAHEYGHHVWQTLPRSERRLYGRLYGQQRETGNLVSDYAGESRDEGFAEAFAFFVTDRPTLDRRDPASERFLQDLLSGQTPGQDQLAGAGPAPEALAPAENGDRGERPWAGRRGGRHWGHGHRWD